MTDRERSRGKRPTTVLAGPYGHPFHPIVVPIPLGAWVSSVVLDVASRMAADGSGLAEASVWLLGIGVVTAVVAAGLGLLDLTRLPTGTRVFRIGLAHMSAMLAATGLFTVGLVVRLSRAGQAAAGIGDIVLSVFALALLGVGGWLGGELTYRYGVRVVDEQTQARGFD